MWNVTVPVGVPPPAAFTTAINVTDWSHTLGFFELVRLVAVATARAAPTLPSKIEQHVTATASRLTRDERARGHAENKFLFMRCPPIFGTVRLICFTPPPNKA
jgi:hypothetical protein